MNKQDVIDAINNVIVSNDQKGITAESLAMILLDMLEVTPENTGGGGGGYEYIDMSYDENGELLPEAIAHNAEFYERFISGAVKGPIMASDTEALMSVSMCFVVGEGILVYVCYPNGLLGIPTTEEMPMGYMIPIGFILNSDGSLIEFAE